MRPSQPCSVSPYARFISGHTLVVDGVIGVITHHNPAKSKAFDDVLDDELCAIT